MGYKKFVLLYVTILCANLLFVGCILYYLSRIYEHNSFAAVIKRQLANNSLYGTMLNENVFAYKLELIKQTQPNIIALGSSRVLQFREEFFTDSFINAGNAMNTINEGELFLEELLKIYKPKLIIIGLDFWYFSPFYPNFTQGGYHEITGTDISLSKIKDIVTLIYQHTFFKPQYIFDNHFISNPYTNLDSLGLNAIYHSRGFLKDGSYIYGEIFYTQSAQDANFKDTLSRINTGTRKFEYAIHIEKERIDTLLRMLKKLKDNDIKTIVFIPPLAPSVYQAMQERSNKYGYIDELFATLENLNINFLNYHNSLVLQSNDCEFLDGFHGGDIYYGKILLDMTEKQSIPSSLINYSYLHSIIASYSGKAFSKTNITNLQEKDFLQLGCKKSPPAKSHLQSRQKPLAPPA